MSQLIKCRVNWLWRRNGKALNIGDPVELTPEEFATYRPRGLVTPINVEVDDTADDDDDVLLGSNTFPAVIAIGEDKQVTLGEVVVEAHKRSGLSVKAWNALPDDEIDAQLEAVVDEWRGEYVPLTDEERKFQERMRTICAAIAKLNPKKAKFWTKDGQPDLVALRKAAGDIGITDAERDAAWALYQKEQQHNAG